MIADRPRSSLPRLTRYELFSRMQLISVAGALIEESFEKHLRKQWRAQFGNSPHGHPWHVSFHASQFPGSDPKACPRKAMYVMADVPKAKPPSRRLTLTAEAGLSIENGIVNALESAGHLISAPTTAKVQTGFINREHWLTGSVDSAVKLKGRPYPIEIKTKHESDIELMRTGGKGPDAKHVAQLRTQMGMIRAEQESGGLWSDLKLLKGGYIYYQPRDTKYDPRFPVTFAEFYFEYDPDWYDKGLEALAEWKQYWLNDVLPTREGKTKRDAKHPMAWLWSYDPCKYCDYKKPCQDDHKAGITKLSESKALEMALEINPKYDYEAARQRVEARWHDTPASAKLKQAIES